MDTRYIKYIDIHVDASATDKAALKKQFADYTKDIAAAGDPTDVVRKSTSQVSYLGLPITKEAYPSDIAARLDSMSVGSVYGPVENAQDNTLNIIKLVAKTQQPDSIQYRQIQVMGATADA